MTTQHLLSKQSFSRRSLFIGGAAAGCLIATHAVAAQPLMAANDRSPAISGTTPVGGIYYEVHGGPLAAGRTPFVLMHGGLMTIETAFAPDLLPRLSAIAPTIAIESQGHGHTPDRSGPMQLDQLVADVIGVLDHLGVPAAHLIGHSLGALTAVEMAIRQPDRVKSVTSLSGVYSVEGQLAELIALQRDPTHKPSAELAPLLPTPEDFAAWAASFDRSGGKSAGMFDLANRINQMRDRWGRWTSQELASIRVPTLLAIGDRDFTRIDHAAEMKTLIPGAQLAVLPGTTHLGMISRGDWLVPMILSAIGQAE
ncbi:alpha/beta hydrolase [Mesorhizobium sp. 1M-11]|uniref:alpha/beta fold hydrolase n=1 Tax=Mesorhizobium sp. 1M-11 TaxID=1529006 RepID=UPI0006C73B9F|nr:alpha/beta hydrolase [Mesorhizobium sp. 1M-11]